MKHFITTLSCLALGLTPLSVYAQAQPRPAGAPPRQAPAQPTPAAAGAAEQAPAPGERKFDPQPGNDDEVNHYHHHYFYAPQGQTPGGPPPYYYSQPTGQMNPSQQGFPPPNYGYGGGGGYGGGYGGGWGGWGGNGAGSTIAGSYMLGAGAMYQGAGQYNLMTAEAAREAEAARAEAMQNQMTYMNDYFLAREANRDYRRQLAGPPITQDEAYHINMSRLPKRLTLQEFDPTTGKINWPDVLKRPEFDKDRDSLNQLFSARTHSDSGVGSENYHDVQMATQDMLRKLHDDIKELSPAEYLTALKYIDGLQFEARFPPGTDPQAPTLSQNPGPPQQ